jgi:hypothetical protein
VNTIFGMVAAQSQTKNDKEARLWDFKFRRLVDVILDSGDGRSKETAYVVTDAGDEFIVTGILGLDVANKRWWTTSTTCSKSPIPTNSTSSKSISTSKNRWGDQ